MTYKEAIANLRLPFERLTILSFIVDTAPMKALVDLLVALDSRNVSALSPAYHALSTALIAGGYRRASGDLFFDFLLHSILFEEHAFSVRAARGEWDEPLSSAMRHDLSLLSRFAQLNSVTLKRFVTECLKEQKPKVEQQMPEDNISSMSSAIWSGNITGGVSKKPARTAPIPQAQATISLGENEWLSYRYAFERLQEEYVSDEALEEMYHRFENTSDWGILLDDIWNFHNAYGMGETFLRYRLFHMAPSGELLGICEPQTDEAELPFLYARERKMLESNVIRFLQGESANNVLIKGAAGTGKTAEIFTLARDFPALRLVFVPSLDVKNILSLIGLLRAQPFRFILFFDDLDMTSSDFKAARTTLLIPGVVPENVMVVGATRSGEDSLFPVMIARKEPPLKDFIALVSAILLKDGIEARFERVQNACIDHAAEKKPISLQGAYMTAKAIADEIDDA